MKNTLFPGRNTALAASLLIAATFAPRAWAVIDKPSEPYVSYTVKSGDTLQSLSRSLLANPAQWAELARLNGLKNPNLINPGFVIDIPRSLINFALQPKLATTGVLLNAHGNVTVNGAPAVAGMPIPEGARVQTAAGSTAMVKLSDGSQFQMMPRSLAEVVSQHGYAMKDPASSISTTWFSGVIRLVEGVLDVAANKVAKRNEPLNVVTPTSVVGVRGTQFRVAYEDPANGAARTEVLEGQVRTDNAAKAFGADISGGFGVVVKPADRDIKVVALLPAIDEKQLPARVERSRESGQASWNVGSISGATAYRTELARDESFSQIILETRSSSGMIDVAPVINGNYFARVRGVDANGLEGFNAMRRIDLVDAPADLTWIREINIAATADYLPDGLLLRVNTSSVDTPRNLQMQIAADAAMTQGLLTLPIAANSTVFLKDVAAGQRRFVRFTGTSPQGITGSSPVYALEIPANWGSTVFGLIGALQTLP